MDILKDKKILLGIAGSIAAYKSLELIRMLQKRSGMVTPMPTKAALGFVTQQSLEVLSGYHPQTDLSRKDGNLSDSLWIPAHAGKSKIKHIEAAYEADLALIAPATANTIAKMAHGMADNLLLETLLSIRCPLLIAPAMETRMWEHPATQANIQILKDRGATIIPPGHGSLASGRSGMGRLAELDEVMDAIYFALAPKDFEKKRVMVTAGPTVEDLDPVRYMSNRSSGKMGVAVAEAFSLRGADVTLIHGPISIPIPQKNRMQIIPVRSAMQMYDAALSLASGMDVVVCAAAVCDHRSTDYSRQKIKKPVIPSPVFPAQAGIHLTENPDILASIGQLNPKPFLVGFAAESENIQENGLEKLRRKNCDLLCANKISDQESGFASNTNQITFLDRNGVVEQSKSEPKANLASRLVDLVKPAMPS